MSETENNPALTTDTDAAKPSSGGGIILHHLNNSRSQRIIWLLEELEVPYEVKHYERTKELVAPPELKAVHPLGKSPVITDGNTVVAESGAIVEYLIEKYGKEAHKVKSTDAGWVDNLYYTHYAEGTLMPILVNKLIFSIIPERTPFFIRPIANLILGNVTKMMIDPAIKKNFELIEEHLAKSKSVWFAGGEQPTSADFMMFFPLLAVQNRAPSSINSNQKISEYIKTILERPAYKRADEKGGEFKIL